MLRENIARYKSLDFFARQVVEGFITGKHRSPFHGFSSEFSDYRHYNSGESTQHIDWHLYARTDRLYVKQYEEETNLRCQLIIDHSGSMLFPLEGQGNIVHPNKLTFAVYAAAVLVELMHRQRDAFGITLVSDGIKEQTPCRSNDMQRRHTLVMLERLLSTVSPQDIPPHTTSLAESLHIVAEQMHRRSLVVLFTDAFVRRDERESLYDALRHLRHNKHEVIIFHTFDRTHELNLEYGSRPYLFIDLESGERLRMQPNQIEAEYSAKMNQMQQELQQRAIQYRIEYLPVDINMGFHQIITPFLLKRSKI